MALVVATAHVTTSIDSVYSLQLPINVVDASQLPGGISAATSRLTVPPAPDELPQSPVIVHTKS
jgi:hypothetical protein